MLLASDVEKIIETEIKSFFNGESIEELEKQYGIEAQNKALKEVKELEKNKKDFVKKVKIDDNLFNSINQTNQQNEQRMMDYTR